MTRGFSPSPAFVCAGSAFGKTRIPRGESMDSYPFKRQTLNRSLSPYTLNHSHLESNIYFKRSEGRTKKPTNHQFTRKPLRGLGDIEHEMLAHCATYFCPHTPFAGGGTGGRVAALCGKDGRDALFATLHQAWAVLPPRAASGIREVIESIPNGENPKSRKTIKIIINNQRHYNDYIINITPK